jgi:hypothetical protein
VGRRSYDAACSLAADSLEPAAGREIAQIRASSIGIFQWSDGTRKARSLKGAAFSRFSVPGE